jgi:energy-coupling factor transporter ATP-binding protein EcfA2
VLRPISHLSRGTRDSFTFAARLTLALRADPEKKKRLLVLDEPFYTLDPDRTLQALRMVRRVQDTHGWQVILFTKDPVLATDAGTVLKNATTYRLSLES